MRPLKFEFQFSFLEKEKLVKNNRFFVLLILVFTVFTTSGCEFGSSSDSGSYLIDVSGGNGGSYDVRFVLQDESPER